MDYGESATVSDPTNLGTASSSDDLTGPIGLILVMDDTMEEEAGNSVIQNLSGDGSQAGVEHHEQMTGSVSEKGAEECDDEPNKELSYGRKKVRTPTLESLTRLTTMDLPLHGSIGRRTKKIFIASWTLFN